MAENIGVELRRDTDLEQRMLEAVVKDRNAQPRSQQLQVGPSSLGGCRELLRASLFESDTVAEPETHWATAAHVGSVMGADLESIFGREIGALEQQRITALFEGLGLRISGAIDLLFVDEDNVTDLKSSDDIGGMLYDLKKNAGIIESLLAVWREGQLYSKVVETPDGGYELTETLVSKLSKLSYYVQVSVYVVGAIQAGILSPNASGRLAFYDRSGQYQEFVVLVITPEEVAMFFDIAQHRLHQVASAQEAYESTGSNPAVLSGLRDMAPSFCFSKKVMCPRRMHCWAGSDWTSENQITSPEHIAAIERYAVGRDMARLADGMKRAAKDELRDVTGITPDGMMLTWTASGAINVVETTVEKPHTMTEVLDVALDKMKAPSEPEPVETDYEPRAKQLGKMVVAKLRGLLDSYGLEEKGKKAELVTRILGHEFPQHQPVEEATSAAEEAPEPDTGAYLRADEHELQANLDGASPVEEAPASEPKAEYEDAATMQRRRDLFGWSREDLVSYAHELGVEDMVSRQDAVEKILTAERNAGAQQKKSAAPAGAPAPQRARETGVRFEPEPYTDEEAIAYRQELLALDHEHLVMAATAAGVATNVPDSFMVQAIMDAQFPPRAGRGWTPNGGTSGDERTDRLRQMQYDADPAMRRNYEKEQ